MTRESASSRAGARAERAVLVGLTAGGARRERSERSLDELGGLAGAAGAEVALRVLQERAGPDPATFLGSGKVDQLAASCAMVDADLIIFDNELSPAQQRNLENALGSRVIDRTQLILDIFARRARTREGKLQVELAQLKYLLPRLVGFGTSLSRLGGGIGTRGPGETKLETDRRRIRHRIAALQNALEDVRNRRGRLRERRQARAEPTVALVGYTNAGKTTLFNRLAREESVASNALFVTLDPLVRQVRLPEGQCLFLSDTVGFIERLPHSLIAAFRATLEEVVEADLLLHVADATGEALDRHLDAVHTVLDEVGATDVPRVLVLNKCDLLDPGQVERLRAAHSGAVTISARTGGGLDRLFESVAYRLGLDMRRVVLEFDETDERDRATLARVYRLARVLSHEQRDGRIALEVDVPRRVLAHLQGSPPPVEA